MGFLAGGNGKVLQPAGDRFPSEREQETGVVVRGTGEILQPAGDAEYEGY